MSCLFHYPLLFLTISLSYTDVMYSKKKLQYKEKHRKPQLLIFIPTKKQTEKSHSLQKKKKELNKSGDDCILQRRKRPCFVSCFDSLAGPNSKTLYLFQ